MFGSPQAMAMKPAANPLSMMPPRRKGLFGSPVKSSAPMMKNDEGQPVVPSGPIPGVRPTGSASISPDAPQMRERDAQAPTGGPLGGSMREPFDYDAAMKALTGEPRKVKDWQKVMAVVGDALVASSGGSPYAVRSLVDQRNANDARQLEAAEQIAKWRYDDWSRQNEADLRASNPFTIGRERLAYDPATGEANVLYRGRQDAEIYADSLGFDRGSEEWNAAAQDFVLRGSGPSAHARDLELDDYRTANDRDLEGYRQENRLEMERTRQRNRSSMEGARQANRMTLRQTPSAGRGSGRRRAVDGNGNAVEWDGKAWVPVK